MKKRRIATLNILLLLLLGYTVQAQSNMLENYQWKNRIILILSESGQEAEYSQQIKAFEGAGMELADRKLLVFLVQKERYRIVDYAENREKAAEWINSEALYRKFSKEDSGFQVLLIGLDGGVKVSQRQILQKEALFGIIDAMPMRRAELRRKKNKN